MFNQRKIPDISRYFFSPVVISIVISICLLVNSFIPRFMPLFTGEKGEFACKHHICGCKTERDCLSHCCCVTVPDTYNMKCALKKNPGEIASAFIESLACAGTPDMFAIGTAIIALPDDRTDIPDMYLCVFLKRLKPVYPNSFQISPPDKPPRIV